MVKVKLLKSKKSYGSGMKLYRVVGKPYNVWARTSTGARKKAVRLAKWDKKR